MIIHNITNALGSYIVRKVDAYEQTDADISLPKKTYLVTLLAIVVALIIFESARWALFNKYSVIAFELLVFVTFVVVLGALLFIVFPAVYN